MAAQALKNYYKILQIDPEAEPEVVEAAYRRLARKYHPDVNRSGSTTQRMQELNEAYAVLRDPARRGEYDHDFRLFHAHQPPPYPRTSYNPPHSHPPRERTTRPPTYAQREQSSARGRTSTRPQAATPADDATFTIDWIIVGIIIATMLLTCPPFIYLMYTTATR